MKRVITVLIACTCATLLVHGSTIPKGDHTATIYDPSQSEDVPRFRHIRRYQKLDDLFEKISSMNEGVTADAETNSISIQKSDSMKEQENKNKYAEEMTDDYYLLPDEESDYDEEDGEEKLDMILNGDREFIDDYIQDIIPDGELSDDPVSKEDSDEESEHSPQSDASHTNWVYYGQRDDLRPGHVRHKPKKSEISEAVHHALKITREGSCKIPQRRVVDIQSIHPNPSKTYIPHCTFLHRCGDDTGCCKTGSMICVPKRTERVLLYFYTKTIGHRDNLVEKLSFINHTECECVHRSTDYMIKDETASVSLRSLNNIRRASDSVKTTTDLVLTTTDPVTTSTDSPIELQRCQCPTEFSVDTKGGKCVCNCNQRGCMRIKRGKEYFGMKDRMCIKNGECQKPTCEFGNYIQKNGRCPKRSEKHEVPQ